MEIIEPKNERNWKIAKKRASFKRNAMNWLVINVFLWFIWYFGDQHDAMGIPWPVWPTVGWGFGLLFQFIGAYSNGSRSMEEEEYEKLQKGGR